MSARPRVLGSGLDCLLEVSLFLSVPEALRLFIVSKTWHAYFTKDHTPVWRDACSYYFGCNVCPAGRTWPQWFWELRGLTTAGSRREEQDTRSRCLHRGPVVLPGDFNFSFEGSFANKEAELQGRLDRRRSELRRELLALAEAPQPRPGEMEAEDAREAPAPGMAWVPPAPRSPDEEAALERVGRRHALIDHVAALTALSSEGRYLSYRFQLHREEMRRRRRHAEDVRYRTQRTAEARAVLTRLRDRLHAAAEAATETATAEAAASPVPPSASTPPSSPAAPPPPPSAVAAAAGAVGMRGLLPDRLLCGNDKPRVKELRKACAALVDRLQRLALGGEGGGSDGGPAASGPPLLGFSRPSCARFRALVADLRAVEREAEAARGAHAEKLEALTERALLALDRAKDSRLGAADRVAVRAYAACLKTGQRRRLGDLASWGPVAS